MFGGLRVPWLGIFVLSTLLVALSAAAATVDEPAGIFAPASATGWWLQAWRVGVVASFLFYIIGVFRLRRWPVSTGAVFVVAAAIQLAPLTGPLLLSSDAYTYWTYGRLAAVHHGNPYADPPSRFPDDPAYRIVGGGLDGQTTIYGPTFTAFSDVEARVVGDSPSRAAFLYRLTAALAIIALLGIAGRVASRPAFAIAFIGWNPLLALHFAGGGHNDVWMLLLALSGVLLARRSRAPLAGAAWALSASVKASVLVLAPLEALIVLRQRRSAHQARLFAAGVVGMAILAAGLATARYGTAWPSSFHRASSQLRQTSSLSSVFELGKVGVGSRTAKLALGLLFVLGYARIALDAWRGRARLGLAASLLILTPAWLVPWYGSWPVAFSAVEDDLVAQVVAALLSGYLLSDAVRLPLVL